MRTNRLRFLFFLCLISIINPSSADPGCRNANVLSGKLITDICWDCVFPIIIAGVPMNTGQFDVPQASSSNPLCTCSDDLGVQRPGVTMAMWQPFQLIEFERVPGCASALNGVKFPADRLFQGTHGPGKNGGPEESFMHYHVYSFPLLTMLDLFSNYGCLIDSYVDFDMLYVSELDPTWNNDELAFFTNPEASLVATPVAQAACPADAVASTARHPIDKLFWCAGSWGFIYPLSGHQYENSSIVKTTSLLTVKVLAAQHRRGLLKRTIGNDALCGGVIDTTIKKSMYKFSVLFPIPETSRAHVLGESTFTWGEARTIPSTGEDLIYTVWRWNQCCNLYGGD